MAVPGHLSTLGCAQPAAGVSVNFGHPQAHGLLGAWSFASSGGNGTATPVVDLVGGQARFSITGTATFAPDVAGAGMRGGAISNLSGASMLVPANMRPRKNASLVWYGTVDSNGNYGATNPALAYISYDSADGAPYNLLGMRRVSNNANNVVWVWNNGSNQASSINIGLPTYYNTPLLLGISLNGDSGRGTFYVGSKVVGTSSAVGTISYSATSTMYVNRNPSSSNGSAGTTTALVGLWGRELTQTDMMALAADPYCFLVPA